MMSSIIIQKHYIKTMHYENEFVISKCKIYLIETLFLTCGVIYEQILATSGKISCQKNFKLKLRILRV